MWNRSGGLVSSLPRGGLGGLDMKTLGAVGRGIGSLGSPALLQNSVLF